MINKLIKRNIQIRKCLEGTEIFPQVTTWEEADLYLHEYFKNKTKNLYLDATLFPIRYLGKKLVPLIDALNELLWTPNEEFEKDKNKKIQRLNNDLQNLIEFYNKYVDDLYKQGYIFNTPLEADVKGTPHIRLYSYDIGSDEYPLTGHSVIMYPIFENGKVQYRYIDRLSDSDNYNLFSSNCADSTGRFLKYIFGDDFIDYNVSFFTPPGVKKSALKIPGAIDKGEYVTIPISKKYMKNYLEAVNIPTKVWESLTDKNYPKRTDGGSGIRKYGGLIKRNKL